MNENTDDAMTVFGDVANMENFKSFFSEPIPHGKAFWDPNGNGIVFEIFGQISAPFLAAVSGTTEMFILAMEQANLIEGTSPAGIKARELLLVLWMAQLMSAGHHSQTEVR